MMRGSRLSHVSGPAGIATVIFGLLFFSLLAFRLGVFQKDPPFLETEPTNLTGRDSWMSILQEGRKIGYAHRRLIPRDEGYDLLDTARLRINTMGMTQEVTFQTVANLRPDLSIDSFSFDLHSSLFHFAAHGKRSGDILTVFTGKQKLDIDVKEGLFLASGTLDAVINTDLKPNQTRQFTIFDPATMGRRSVKVTMKGSEVLEIMGRKYDARKMLIEFMGTTQYAWIGEDGSVLQEDGLMGIRLQRTTKRAVLEGMPLAAGPDLTEMASILPKGDLRRAKDLTRLRVSITGLADTIDLNGGRQRYASGVLEILREDLNAGPEPDGIDPAEYLSATPLVQSDDPRIRQLVSEVVSSVASPMEKGREIMHWIHDNIEKRPVISVPNALETLENRMGDCNEHAVLMAAMARAAGIPSHVEAGLVFTRGRFYYHAWNSLFLDRWVTVDALMGQMPADVTHIRLVRGETEQQIDLLGVIGRVQVEILEPEQ